MYFKSRFNAVYNSHNASPCKNKSAQTVLKTCTIRSGDYTEMATELNTGAPALNCHTTSPESLFTP